MSSTLSKSKPTEADIDKQIRRGKALLRELKATLEDLEDRRELAAARKRFHTKHDQGRRKSIVEQMAAIITALNPAKNE